MPSKPTSQLLQEQWGKAVRAARGQRSQTWLARKVGVDQTVISRIERGTYKLSPELMIGLAAALDIELEDLFRFPPGLIDIERYRADLREREAEIRNLKATAS